MRDLLLRGKFGPTASASRAFRSAWRSSGSPTWVFSMSAATGGFLVREFTIDEVRDAIELRAVLDGTAARLAAERLGDEAELDELRRCWEAIGGHTQLSIDSFARYTDDNESFPAAIVNLAKSVMLRRVLDRVNSLPFAAPSAMVFPTWMLAAAEETLATAQVHHRCIVEAIERRARRAPSTLPASTDGPLGERSSSLYPKRMRYAKFRVCHSSTFHRAEQWTDGDY